MMVSRQLEQVLLVYYQLWRTSLFQCCSCNLNTLAKNWLKIFFWGLIAVQNCIIIINLMILSNILLKITCSSERHSRFSWIVMDQPCFSDVRFSKLICSPTVIFAYQYTRNSMVQTSLELWKDVRDRGSPS